ncbi:zinc dependent phospholipase C family protein [Anaeroselena agilis]|uniref:Phospholipase C n=1 Tax=Anaeroselena agilis TaxID=3063788 RepID=A0ABU3NZD0_9FIRM|nr:zinc dependent phospholipase C family protein [Selenomonadales bacterium 4137-cl]
MKTTGKATASEVCLRLLLAAVSPLQGMLDRPGITHGFCNRQALQILRGDGFTRYAEFLQLFGQELDCGVYWADQGWKNIHHYFEPTSGKGLWHFANARQQFAAYYRTALLSLRRADPRRAAFLLGAAAHLVQDLCVPHHARAKMLDGHKQYETWVEKRFDRYAVNTRGVYGEDHPACSLLVANAVIAADFFDSVKREEDETAYHKTTEILLPLAQRTTAGLMWHFANEAVKAGIDMTTAVAARKAVA